MTTAVQDLLLINEAEVAVVLPQGSWTPTLMEATFLLQGNNIKADSFMLDVQLRFTPD